MTQTALAGALLLALGAPAFAQSIDTPPSTPGNPTARAYGPTSGGVAWQRSTDDRAVRGYEITRDGTVIGVRDTLSYIADDLAPGRGYNVAIVAIDSAGQRSGRALARIETPDARPNTPTGLRASVYSASAAGLAWQRSGVFGERYEIRRDGRLVVASTDATSYIDTTLSASRPYLFELIAVNRQGQRSAAARLFVDTRGGSGNPPPPPVPGPPAPRELRAVIYSATAGAIAWARSDTAGLRHEVSRDGAVLATTNGTSYVEQSLTGGRTYRYSVVAIDRRGNRSAASTVALVTPSGGAAAPPSPADDPFTEPDPDAASVLARLGYPGARELADDLVSTSYLSLYYDIAPALLELLSDDGSPEDTLPKACPEGGRVSGEGGTFFFNDVVLEDCGIDGRTLSGGLLIEADVTIFAAGDVQLATASFDALRIDAGEAGSLLVSGSSSRRDSASANQVCDGAPTFVRAVDNRIDSARVENADGTTTLSEASWTQTLTTQPLLSGRPTVDPCVASRVTLSFEGEASVVAERLGAGGTTLRKRGEIVRDSREDVAAEVDARLAADFGDGSTLAVTAIADDEAQVDIVAEGASLSFTDDYRFEAREDFPTITGN